MRHLVATPNVQVMTMLREPESDCAARVLLAGGGVAALEALTSLRARAGDRVRLELVCPQRTFDRRSVAVAAGLDEGMGSTVELRDLADSIGAPCTIDALASVRPAMGMATLANGETRSYDVLLVATGARPEESIPGALMLGTADGTERFRQLLAQAEAGAVSRLVFAVPDEACWLPALYELALLTAARLRAAGAAVQITLVTHEPAPLAALAEDAGGAMRQQLEDHGVEFVAGLHPEEIAWGELRASPGQVRIRADGVVTFPRLRGLAIRGLPSDEHGFIPVDAHGLVLGTTNVYAAGDAAVSATKDDALAFQQADAVVEAIVARLGAGADRRAEPGLESIPVAGAGR